MTKITRVVRHLAFLNYIKSTGIVPTRGGVGGKIFEGRRDARREDQKKEQNNRAFSHHH